MTGNDIFRHLNAMVFGGPMWREDCELCGDGKGFICSSCITSLSLLTQPDKLKLLIKLRSLDERLSKVFEKTFHVFKLEDADLLKNYRKSKNWSRDQVAHALDIPRTEIAGIEKGDRPLPDDARMIIKKTKGVLGVVPGSDKTPLEAA